MKPSDATEGATPQPTNEDTTLGIPQEQLHRSVQMMEGVIGHEVSAERIKHFLYGADGNVEIALNHIFATLEKEEKLKTIDSETLDSVLTELAEEVKCPLCLCYLSQPVVLGCLHTFCVSCLESIVEDSSISCPMCRSLFSLDENGVKGLKTNHYLANIVEKLRKAQTARMCAECSNSLCKVFCKDCKACLCDNCNEKIHSLRLMGNHNRIPFEDCFFPTRRPSISITSQSPGDNEYVVPFSLNKEICRDLFKSWTKSLWFLPLDFHKKIQMDEFESLYIPYWSFEVEATSHYNCTVSHQSIIAGQQDSWSKWPTTGVVFQKYSELLICASDSPESSFLKELEPWKCDTVQSFTLQHTEGAQVRPFTLSAEKAWELVGRQRVERLNEQICEHQVRQGRSTYSHLYIETKCAERKHRRLFLPMYRGSYRYAGKEYIFLVNGTTAAVFGQRPYSASKLTSLSLGGLGAALSLLTRR